MRKWKLGDFKSHNKLFAEGRLEPLSATAQLTDFLDQAICPHTLTLYHMKVSVRPREGVLLSTVRASGQRRRGQRGRSQSLPALTQVAPRTCRSCLTFPGMESKVWMQSHGLPGTLDLGDGDCRSRSVPGEVEAQSGRVWGGLGTCCDCEVVGRF